MDRFIPAHLFTYIDIDALAYVFFSLSYTPTAINMVSLPHLAVSIHFSFLFSLSLSYISDSVVISLFSLSLLSLFSLSLPLFSLSLSLSLRISPQILMLFPSLSTIAASPKSYLKIN